MGVKLPTIAALGLISMSLAACVTATQDKDQMLAAAGFRPEPPRTLDGGDLAIKVWTGARRRLSAKPAPVPASPLPIPSLSL